MKQALKKTAEVRLENLLTLEHDDSLDLEKAIRSIAYLLEWGSTLGNEPMNGNAANGLHYLLHKCADETRWLFTLDDLKEAGGDPNLLRRRA
jgi:hypothetical protein